MFGGGPWFGGGFAVGWSKTEGWEAGCDVVKNQRICVWTWQRFQDYNIRYELKTGCGVLKGTVDKRVRSPMRETRFFESYCVVNTCRGDGDQYWKDEGKGRW